jgi:hypothetical protein
MHLDSSSTQESGMQPQSLIPEDQPIVVIDSESTTRRSDVSVVATADHDLIRQWAAERRAEPATGQATASGPATVSVNDAGTGLRFNFPGIGRFRPINWREWFDGFDALSLAFVFERDQPGQTKSNRYRLIPFATLREIARVI